MHSEESDDAPLREHAVAGGTKEARAPAGQGDPILTELRALWTHRSLLTTLTLNDLKYRYMGSSIGFFWSVLNPLVELITYTFVFHVLMGVQFSERGGTVHYSLFLFCGMIGWFALAEGCQRATWSIRENAQLIKKVNFPAAVLPASVVFSAVINQYIRFGVLALAIIFLGTGAGAGLSPTVLTLPLFVALQAIFVLGLSFFLATAHVYFRDTGHWVNALFLAWMFITPIFYPPHAYPQEFQILLQLNPMAHFVGIYQEIMLNARMPHMRQMLFALLYSFSSLVIGYSVFVNHRKKFADLV
jgi:lipopolysaccharide transport system permease protein